MPRPRLSLQDSEPAALREGLAGLRTELGIPATFPAEVLAEAETAASRGRPPSKDQRDVEFVTLDPPTSTDLDQAFHLSRTPNGYLLRYAIADVAAFVTPGGAIDRETRQRGETLYAPTAKTPLHPAALSEAAASLLPGVDRPALVWSSSSMLLARPPKLGWREALCEVVPSSATRTRKLRWRLAVAAINWNCCASWDSCEKRSRWPGAG